jgi:D-sedoheptulose 7-phosphate isomerase
MLEKQPVIDWPAKVKQAFEESIAVKKLVIEKNLSDLVNIAMAISTAIQNGNTLFLCGNGGSLADAQHLAAELLVRLTPQVNRQSLPAVCLAMDMSTVTACGNDYGFDEIFARSLEGLGRKGDILLGLSTSSKSKNVRRAFEQAKCMNIKTVGFLGCGGGTILPLSDLSLVIPSDIAARIQESHITAGHVLMEMIENMLDHSGYLNKMIP